MINGITFSEQMFTSADFAHFMYTFLNHANGITKGCEISHADGNVYIQKGYFMQCGRMVRIIGTEEIPSPEVVSGQLYCKVVFEIDLTKSNTIEEFNQGYFRTLTGTAAYPELTREDLDNDGTLHQIPWCQYIKTVEEISEFEDIREVIDVTSVWGMYEDLNAHISDKNNPHGVTAEQVGAAPSSHKHAASDITSGILPVQRGGTNASDRVNAFYNLAFIGNQPIASTNDDTITNWNSKGSGFCTYGTDGLLIDQPSQYGFLINYVYSNVEVGQIWITRPTGVMYVRGGNGSGWSGTWKKLFNDSQVIPVPNGGTGCTSLNAGTVLIGNGTAPMTCRAITNSTSAASASGTNIPTCNTINHHVQYWLNRGSAVHQANTGYDGYRARGIALVTAVPSSITNGCCAFVYE